VSVGARRYWLIWVAVVPLAVWALVRVFGLDSGFPLVPLMAFTSYAAVAALLVAGVAVALRNWAAAAVTALVTLCLAVAVLPRAIGDETVDPDGRETFVVLSTNVHHGTADPATIVELVDRYGADLLSVQELTPSFARELRAAGLEALLPNAVLETHRSASGAGLYSRLPMRRLPGSQFFFRQPRATLSLADGRRIRVVGVHPFPPGRGNDTVWQEALESLPSAGAGAPWILVGDFNATLDVSLMRETVDRGYRDAGEVAGEGLVPTFPQNRHLIPPITIDHILADERLGVIDYEVEDLPGSDHRALYAELALPWRAPGQPKRIINNRNSE
jgi:endonuclease/exonuclease/phosphatase (EEP) superfamily protein YafD